MIVSLFGPDGVGKTTIASQLSACGLCVFSGTHVDEWPDKAWAERLFSEGINESSLNSETHFREKIRRCHMLARELEVRQRVVVIDSDPLHKTLLHHYMRAPSRKANDEMKSLLAVYERLANYDNSAKRLHVSVRISDSLSDQEQASILLERLSKAEQRDQFDPCNLAEAVRMVEASKVLTNILRSQGRSIVVVENYHEPQTQKLYSRVTDRA